MSKTTLIALFTLVVASFAAPATAGMHGDDGKADGAMAKKAVEHYAAIADALADDSVEGVPAHAQALKDMMPMCSEMHARSAEAMKGEGHKKGHEEGHMKGHEEGHMEGHMEGKAEGHMKGNMMGQMKGAMHENAEKAHQAMNQALDTLASDDVQLANAREAFTTLSQHFVPMARASYPEDAEKDYVVMHCPMAPGSGDWIQSTGETHNPYHGSKMPKCGNKVAMLGQTGSESEQSKGDESQREGDEGY